MYIKSPKHIPCCCAEYQHSMQPIFTERRLICKYAIQCGHYTGFPLSGKSGNSVLTGMSGNCQRILLYVREFYFDGLVGTLLQTVINTTAGYTRTTGQKCELICICMIAVQHCSKSVYFNWTSTIHETQQTVGWLTYSLAV